MRITVLSAYLMGMLLPTSLWGMSLLLWGLPW